VRVKDSCQGSMITTKVAVFVGRHMFRKRKALLDNEHVPKAIIKRKMSTVRFLVAMGQNIASWLLKATLLHDRGWPIWAANTIISLLFIMACVALVGQISARYSYISMSAAGKRNTKAKTGKKTEADAALPSTEFRWFQLQYLSVYLVVMLADWLQGPNMYSLYSSYGVDVGTLFLTGFASSAVFGTFLGVYVDRWGRKLGCLIFCVLEIIINLLESVPSMPVLVLGRVLGGMSTSLLFSSFESWMVSQHRKRGFSEALLASTFAISSWGNGAMGFSAGLLGQVATDVSGDIGPFRLAVALTVVALLLISTWDENYGEGHGHGDGDGDGNAAREGRAVAAEAEAAPARRSKSRSKNSSARAGAGASRGASRSRASSTSRSTSRSTSSKRRKGASSASGIDLQDSPNPVPVAAEAASIFQSLKASAQLCSSERRILLLGTSQAVYEGGMYTFVFMWYKVMARTLEGETVPAGLVMTAFMLAMSIGGMLFSILLPFFPGGAEGLSVFTYVTAAAAMAVPVVSFRFEHIFTAFLVLEITVGMFNSCGATLRSRYYPDKHQSSIMNVFRVPLNFLVVIGTKMSDWSSSEAALKRVFCVVVAMHLAATLLQLALVREVRTAEAEKHKHKH